MPWQSSCQGVGRHGEEKTNQEMVRCGRKPPALSEGGLRRPWASASFCSAETPRGGPPSTLWRTEQRQRACRSHVGAHVGVAVYCASSPAPVAVYRVFVVCERGVMLDSPTHAPRSAPDRLHTAHIMPQTCRPLPGRSRRPKLTVLAPQAMSQAGQHSAGPSLAGRRPSAPYPSASVHPPGLSRGRVGPHPQRAIG